MNKLLITGVSGFLGWNIYQLAKSQWQVYGTCYSHYNLYSQQNIIKTDLTDLVALKNLFKTIDPSAVIHTAAASKPNFCQTNPIESYEINVTASMNLAHLCAEYQIPCIFTSTDLVFDGQNPPYSETDPVSPISYYGEQKVVAEQQMLEIYPATAVCRMPLMFGMPSPTANSFIQGFIDNLQTGKELNLFIDEFRTPVSGTMAAQGLLLALEQQVSGLLHLGGKERISRYQFGLLLAETMGFSTDLIKPCRQKDVVMAAPRSPDTSLHSSKAFALGYQPLSLKEQLSLIPNSGGNK
ncbi:dTDP-4-dehydrorhamnose reductase [Stanieria cyanosphaera PCC 7437]|uniref:dTDP-4-dehydrorhamnose reductase n=1 Tax=Stanieria cyanosphaera (strain ATCC 29371 / PCC 7437) TaxID=111780 RepID=K9XT73_STAC7|nr:SDR family oxidoreductase [Stanieria cyanosphaera]AFZ35733.1 dTDP-4-dehydrorhamnose reductase [Stanieria cyanosphaera PCC 7437]